jgi:excisionase family DNA binding protein
VRDLPTSVVAAAAGPTAATRLVGMSEWMQQRAAGAKAQAEVRMSSPKGKKTVGDRGAIPSSLSLGAGSEVLTLQDVADYLHCHYTSAHRLARRGDIPSFRLGGSWRFLKSEVDEWIAKGGGRRPSEKPAVKPEGGAHKRKPRPRSR